MANIYSYDQLFNFTYSIFKSIGCEEEDAIIASKVLVSADVKGIDSHGVARLSGYVKLWEKNRINTSPAIKIMHQTPSTASVDGDSGLGLVVAPFAMSLAIEKAKKVGTGWVAVSNSTHFGIAGYYSMMALKEDMIGIAMSNASALVAPTFSIEKMLGTNPISVAFPADKQPPFVADFATTTSGGKLEFLKRNNSESPIGLVQDEKGNVSSDPEIIKKNGSLLPLGGDREHGSHKGYALSSIVDILSGIVSGANYGPWVPPFSSFLEMPSNLPGKGVGHFFGALSIDAFRPAIDFKQNMDKWIERFREAKPIEGYNKVFIPGDRSREAENINLKIGISIHDVVVDELQQLGKKFNITI
jgi:L-2-hydroxycarboxylate dehydrogenase (NAD+)